MDLTFRASDDMINKANSRRAGDAHERIKKHEERETVKFTANSTDQTLVLVCLS